jgi:dipeptide/tripeptide permease
MNLSNVSVILVEPQGPPNISGVVGLLYHDGDHRRDAGFGLFYSGINVGAFLGGWLCFKLGDSYGWEWAFISAGVAMLIGVTVFTLTANTLGPLGNAPLPRGFPPLIRRRPGDNAPNPQAGPAF